MHRIKGRFIAKHGYASNGYIHPLLRKVYQIKQRCYNINASDYKNYGGRGIRMCAEWYFYPEIFIKWALGNGWKKELCIDRINNDGNYTPENCRFITIKKSNKNKRLLSINNTSGYKGVVWHKYHKKWAVFIRINGARKYLGYFKSPRLAALRYDVEAYLLNDGRSMNFIDNHKTRR